MLVPLNNVRIVASVGKTSDTSEKRAVLQAMWEGSFLLSSFFAYFFSNGKSMKIKSGF
jgi:hypothetical protein